MKDYLPKNTTKGDYIIIKDKLVFTVCANKNKNKKKPFTENQKNLGKQNGHELGKYKNDSYGKMKP